MTTMARQVLFDCQIALNLLEEETILYRWRVNWVAAITLIRAVGHVLDKIDGKNPKIKKISKDLFISWKQGEENSIFRDFIDQERNNILKEYVFATHPLEKVDVVLVSNLRDKEGNIATSSEVFGIEDNIYRPLLDGYRNGDDARDVFLDAIKWWDRQLNVIDEKLSLLQ